MPLILDGRPVRDRILNDLKPRIQRLLRPPGLAAILAGSDPASEVYVNTKVKTCGEIGIHSEKIVRPDSVTTEELLALVEELNARPEIDGILVQMPLPPQVESQRILEAVLPEKDVDGFHPVNTGKLSLGMPGPRPCTPHGIVRMLEHYGIEIAGRDAVVVGRSDIVGKPMAMLLTHANATVTICHSKTRDLQTHCQRADILVAAIGRPALITGDYIKPGAAIVDVGMNRISSPEAVEAIWPGDTSMQQQLRAKGRILIGDVHPGDAARVAGAMTPVPGGVGPLTIAMLMQNTVEAAERSLR